MGKVRSFVAVTFVVASLLAIAGAFAGPALANEHGNKNASCDETHHSETGKGANQNDTYDNTCDGSASGNGNGNGNGSGKPCAGCVGNADDKNPGSNRGNGQEPKPAGSDRNNGYECDGNKGIARTNPAHTGCRTTSITPDCPAGDPECPTPECPPGDPDCATNCPPGDPECPTPECPPGDPDCATNCPPGDPECPPPPCPLGNPNCPRPPIEGEPVQQDCVDDLTTPEDECDLVLGDTTEPDGDIAPNTTPAERSGTAPSAETLPLTGPGVFVAFIAGIVLIGAGIAALRRSKQTS